ncbi:putative retrograde regulation protein 2 [Diplodia seriata]|uniref:Putative retrograde regulation protein 2 n=1 Tax=Diplodia seriata TaxID=420778 RepID=A0A0G2E5N5_9PEZI|nr:putative retrograde regulation protein 2 [Diplodia seriata]
MEVPSPPTMEAKIQVSETSDSRPESLDIDYEAEKKLLRKLDWHILPIVAPLYVFSFLDRINIGNGRLYGLEEDLNLSSMQFSIALSVFFVTYVIVEIPSNLIIKRVGASRWIPFITFTWGVIATCTGLAQKFQDLVALRLLLGLFEGGFVPGIQLYLTSFYTKKEMAIHMDGYLGYRGWRWIMILEGIPTSALAVLAYLLMADSPTSASYLTPAEKTLLLTRQHRSNNGHPHPSHPTDPTTATDPSPSPRAADISTALSSPHTWAFAAIGFCSATVNYGYSIFLPTLLDGLYPAWSTPHIQAMTIPYYGAGVAACLLLARRAAGKEDWKLAGLTPEQIEELGDRSPHFVYTA